MRKLWLDRERFELVIHLLREYLSTEQTVGKLHNINIPNLKDAYVWPHDDL